MALCRDNYDFIVKHVAANSSHCNESFAPKMNIVHKRKQSKVLLHSTAIRKFFTFELGFVYTFEINKKKIIFIFQ